MNDIQKYSWLPAEDIPLLCTLIEDAISARSLEEMSDRLLPLIIKLTGAQAACLYVPGAPSPTPKYYQHGLRGDSALEVEEICVEWSSRIADRSDLGPLTLPHASAPEANYKVILYPLRLVNKSLGLICAIASQGKSKIISAAVDSLGSILAAILDRTLECSEKDEQLAQLNTYLTVSSALSQSMDLHELLEISMFCCMQAVPSDAGSILLLDDEKNNFIFYEVGGPSAPVLKSATFPADRGIAGSVLQNRQAEIINDPAQDARFYGKVDSESGFQTKNIIAIPLIAENEKVGVLELLNKADGSAYTDGELQMLLPLTDEIAFAIRNAILFDYVVGTYCKQRQGLASCKGCQRPLGTWTPCVKYQATSVWNDSISPGDTLIMPKPH